jgi:hypothetical protein
VTEWCGEWTGVMGLPGCIRSEGGSESRGDCEWGGYAAIFDSLVEFVCGWRLESCNLVFDHESFIGITGRQVFQPLGWLFRFGIGLEKKSSECIAMPTPWASRIW